MRRVRILDFPFRGSRVVGAGAVAALASVAAAAPLIGQAADASPPAAHQSERADGAVTGWEFDFFAHGPYRDDVPRPPDVLGYEMGEFHARYGLVERYMEALARAAPDRVALETYGESYERRPLLIAFISSPENLERREEIRQAVNRLADPRATSRAEAARLAAETPIIVWLNYGTDGEESAATEAGLQVAYQLVAGDSEEMRRFRDEALVILTPVQNPESHQRFVFWYNAFGIGAEHPLAAEKHPPWGISNDNNHYQIDLNRDAHTQTQRESQAMGAQVLRWRPQVFVDHHGQTETYYFPPPVMPVNPDLPEASFRWMEAFGRGNARAFDEQGWQYWSRDVFDHFYPGYWETWPSLMGATGMTYETTGGGRYGLRHRRADGTLLTLRLGIAQHFVASLATLRTAVEHREARLRDFHDFFRTGAEEAGRGGPRAFLLESGLDPRRAAVLASALLRHGIEVGRAEAPFRARATSHATGREETREFPAGTYLVDLAQPAKRIASTLLSLHRPMEDEFLARQYARWSRNARRGEDEPKEGYEFYDVTSWSLPLAYGVAAHAVDQLPGVGTRPVEVPWERLATSGDWADELLFVPTDLDGVGVEGRAGSAYVFRPEAEGALRLVAGLLREGFVVNVARRPIAAGERELPAGSFVVRSERNPASVHDRIGPLAVDAGIRVLVLESALQERGQWGVGASVVVPLRAPRILVMADEGVSETSYGGAWFTLERRLGYPFTPVRFGQVPDVDLSEFDVLVLPDGSAAGYRRGFGEEGAERLARWLEAGGTLVAWGGAAAFAMEQGWISASRVGEGEGEPEAEGRACLEAIDAVAAAGTAAAGTGANAGPPAVSPTARPCALQSLSGAVLRARPDPTHWLPTAAGLGADPLPVLVRGSIFLTLSERGASPLVFAPEGELVASGFVWPGNSERWLAGQAYAVVDPVGSGQVIAFSGDPTFRAAWRSTARLFSAALLVGPSMAEAGRRSW